MNERLFELASRQGALRARIAEQRRALAMHSQPLASALAVVDRGRDGFDWLKQHPGIVGVAAACLVILKPRRAFRWAQRGFLLWRGWKSLRNRTLPAGRP